MYFDPTYFVFVLPALFFAMWAQWRVQSTFGKYTQVANSTGLTGAQVARRVLDAAGLSHINVERIPGNLTDHYDPGAKVVRLSDPVYATPSVAAIGVAAHEVGHAIQDATAYAPMRLRQGLVPVAGIGSNLGYILFFIGFLISSFQLAILGFILFEPTGLYGRWLKIRLYFQTFPMYKAATFKKQKTYVKSERNR